MRRVLFRVDDDTVGILAGNWGEGNGFWVETAVSHLCIMLYLDRAYNCQSK
ncbi:MAG: hypothetical protein IAF02_13430 [Anaerolineae bacterium]|nr:hypothetical protein [Anaerolineae bacterium]